MTAAYGTGAEFVPVPVDLGQALAFPGMYLEPPAGLPRAARAPRVRRPGRIRCRMAASVAVAVSAGLAVARRASGARADARGAWDSRPGAGTGPARPMREANLRRRHDVAGFARGVR